MKRILSVILAFWMLGTYLQPSLGNIMAFYQYQSLPPCHRQMLSASFEKADSCCMPGGASDEDTGNQQADDNNCLRLCCSSYMMAVAAEPLYSPATDQPLQAAFSPVCLSGFEFSFSIFQPPRQA